MGTMHRDPHAIVKTTLWGTIAYGGVVKQTIAARVDVKTGGVVSIISEKIQVWNDKVASINVDNHKDSKSSRGCI